MSKPQFWPRRSNGVKSMWVFDQEESSGKPNHRRIIDLGVEVNLCPDCGPYQVDPK